MDITQIKILLEKYDEGRTSLQEEQDLRNYFRDGTTIPEFLPYMHHFRLIQAASHYNPVLKGDLETRLSQLIDSREQLPKHNASRNLFFRIAAAATIAIIIGVSGILVIQDNWHKNRDTFSDPKQAYAEAQKTLLYVSHKMNRGIEPLSSVSKINAGNQSLKSLNKLNKNLDMIYLVSFINNSSNLKK